MGAGAGVVEREAAVAECVEAEEAVGSVAADRGAGFREAGALPEARAEVAVWEGAAAETADLR